MWKGNHENNELVFWESAANLKLKINLHVWYFET